MRHNLSFKEFLELSEAGALPPDLAKMNSQMGKNLRATANKTNVPDSRKAIDKVVLKTAAQNPMAADALADKVAKRGTVR